MACRHPGSARRTILASLQEQSAWRTFHGVPQPHHAAFKRFAMREAQRLPGSGAVPLGPIIIHDALRTGHAINGGMDQGAELINKLVLQKGAVDLAAAFEKKRFDTKQR